MKNIRSWLKKKIDGKSIRLLFSISFFLTISLFTMLILSLYSKSTKAQITSFLQEKNVQQLRRMSFSMEEEIEDFDDVEAIVLPGGMPGTTNLEASEVVKEAIEYCSKNDILIGAICAAPSILGKKMLLEDKKATCFPGYEKYLYGADVKSDKVVVDGKFITGKGAGAAADFGFAMLAILKDKETADRVKETMQY